MDSLNVQFHEDDRLFEQSEDIRAFRFDAESSADWNYDYAAAESVEFGQGQGIDGEILIPENYLDLTLMTHDNEGSNLVDPSGAVVIKEPTLLDLPRVPANKQLFESFTHTGTSSSALSFRPFSLKHSSRYMLQVSATSNGSLLGRAQIFLVAKPAPQGMMCQVQPTTGKELFTQFSIFCTSGRKDLVYEYSYSVGARPAEIMYQGTDFQYYFHLPSGDPSNEYQVTIYTQIRSRLFGTSTKVCPVHVQVQPSFVREIGSTDAELELSKFGIETITDLVKLGNKPEIRHYIRLLYDILNRPDRHNTSTQRRLHGVLVCTVCQLEADSQASMVENIRILKDLLHVSNQVTMLSLKRVTLHLQTVSLQLSDTTGPSPYNLDQQMLRNLLTLLSYCLHAFKAHYIPKSAEITHDIILDTFKEKERATDVSHNNDCTKSSYDISMKTRKGIVRDVLQLAYGLILKYLALLKAREGTVSTGGMLFCATHLNRTTSTLNCSSGYRLYMPTSITHFLLDREECVITLLTELTDSPYTWARYPAETSGPVINFSLYKCSTRSKISVRALIEPIIIEVHQPKREQESSIFTLRQGSISYHSFNITQKHLQQSILIRLRFSPAVDYKPFPIMLLFRMYKRPTPSMYHQKTMFQWKSMSTYITFPPSYFNAAGLGYLALLNANFEQPLRNWHLSRWIKYTLEVVTAQCLSWDEPRGLWTHNGCWTHQTEAAVNCSCYHLRPLTVAQEPILSFHETTELEPFRSMSGDLTVVSVLSVIICLFVPILVVCKKADLISKDDQRVHYLADNSSLDSHLYAVTIHTGLCSAARMSAKVYIVLYGENGVSQTKELQFPGFTFFGKNSQTTFILSVSDHLGPVHGVHIWHDNSGLSPFWYINLIEVAEVNGFYVKQDSWLFVCRCWLAVTHGDGQVERKIRRTHGMSLAQMLCLKLSDYLSDYHTWISVYSRPRPSSFTHCQRLGLCLVLLLGYAGANALMISQMNQLLVSDLGFVGVPLVAVRTGFLSVMVVLPVATLVHIFFRRCTVRNNLNSQDNSIMSGQTKEAHDIWLNLQKQDIDAYFLEEREKEGSENIIIKKMHPISRVDERIVFPTVATWKKTEQLDNRSEPDIISGFPHTKDLEENNKDLPSQWFHCLAWTLCLLLSLLCFLISTILGLSFSDGKVLLWIHSFFFSLLFCVIFIQPALILAVTTAVCFSNKVFGVSELETLSPTVAEEFNVNLLPERPQTIERVLAARRRSRYLQLMRPPSQIELRSVRAAKTREAHIRNTLWDLCMSVAMIMMLMNSSSSFTDQQYSNMIQQHLTRRLHYSRIGTDADWWEWAQNQLLDVMYNNNSDAEVSHRTLVGKPLLQKMEVSFQCQVLRMTVGLQDQVCEQSATVHLGLTRTETAEKLKVLESAGWLAAGSLDVIVQFTFFSPAPNLFTTVTCVAEQRKTGVLLPPAKVQSVQLHYFPALHDYGAMLYQLVFVVISLLHLWLKIYAAGQEGLIRYCKSHCNWMELIVLPVVLLYVVRHIDHSSLLLELVDMLQRHTYREHVDIGQLATKEQEIQSLRGILLFIFVVKCVIVVNANKTVVPHVNLTKLLLSVISSLTLLVSVSIIRSLLTSEQNLDNPGYKFLHYKALSSAVLFSTLVSSCSWIKKAKQSQSSAGVCTIAELVDYIRKKGSELTGGPPQTDVDMKTYYLEEFDCLLDELLYRLNSLYYTLPGPSLTPESIGMDSQSWTEATHTCDLTGYDAQQLGSKEMGGGEEMLILGPRLKRQPNLIQQKDLIRENVSSPWFVSTLRCTEKSRNCLDESPKSIEGEGPMTQPTRNVLVEVLVHATP